MVLKIVSKGLNKDAGGAGMSRMPWKQPDLLNIHQTANFPVSIGAPAPCKMVLKV